MKSVVYEDLSYSVFKKISVEFTPKVKEHNMIGLNFYILRCPITDFRFGYVTGRNLPLFKKIYGRELHFLSGAQDELTAIPYYKDIWDEFQTTHKVRYKKVYSKKQKKYIDKPIQTQFYPQEIFYKIKETPSGDLEYKNIFAVHTNKIVIDKELWFIEELRNKKIKSLKKKVIRELLEDTFVDERILRLIKSQFFKIQYAMDYNTHAIVLSQGKTGKSSALRPMSRGLENSSNAGIFGYYDVSKGSWVSGLVQQTELPILIDEINELIEKKSEIFTTINTPLENGQYTYGKAGGMDIKFYNQFLFVGNISDEFNFNSFVSSVASNTETIGRRFGYIIYDTKLDFKKGVKRRPKEPTENMILLSSFVTYVLELFMKHRKFHEKKFQDTKIKQIENDFRAKLINMTNSLEEGNDLAKKFLNSFLESSIDERCKMLALKSAIFDNVDSLINLEDIKSTNLSFIYQDYYEEYNKVLMELEQSIKNIIDHVNSLPNQDYDKEISLKKFKRLPKKTQAIIEELSKLHNKEPRIIFHYNELENKTDFKNDIYDIKKGRKSTSKLNNSLKNVGVNCSLKDNDIIFVINNKGLFNKYSLALKVEDEEHIDTEIPEKQKEKSFEEKQQEILDEIGDEDLI